MIHRLFSLITTFLLLVLPASAFAQQGPGNMGSGGRMGWMMDCMGSGGVMMLFPLLITILVIVLLVMGIIALAKYIRQG